jgi:hypothetical protein
MNLRSLFMLAMVIPFHSTLFSQQFEKLNTAGMKWHKGNLHTHAREGESDSPAK